jgi:hypothetical protein
MKICKKCKKVKYDWQFFKEWYCCIAGCISDRTDVCKSCAKEIGYDAVIEFNNKD